MVNKKEAEIMQMKILSYNRMRKSNDSIAPDRPDQKTNVRNYISENSLIL
jgi:hypothetical protein